MVYICVQVVHKKPLKEMTLPAGADEMTISDEWIQANIAIGLSPREICPGLTVDQHAESLAMWKLHDSSNEVYDDFLKTLKGSMEVSLYGNSGIFQPENID